MTLYINTSLIDSLEVFLKKDDKIIIKKKVAAKKQQAEKLLITIEELLKKAKLKLKDIKEIRVANYGGTFTGLRVGILTANALAFALKIPVKGFNASAKNIKKYRGGQLVLAIYNREINIAKKSAK